MAEELREEMEEGEGRGPLAVLSLIVILLLLIGAYMFFFNDRTPTPEEVVQDLPTSTRDTSPFAVGDNVIFAQASAGDDSVTANATLESPGYVVVHEDDVDQPGSVIGNSDLLPAGNSSDVIVELDRVLEDGEIIYAMLHSDDGDGAYEFPGDDGPVLDENGDPLMMMVNVTEAGTRSEEVQF